MQNLTRDGICYNFLKTPYEVKVPYYNNKELIYKFSSKNNVRRFKEKLEENRKKINDSISKRFKFDIQNDLICDIKLYSMIETRGFLITGNGVFLECLENIQLTGAEVTSKN